mmetsp:Transcript_125444/g.360485  ORF Transcript_125444/g.360485 Transcript_125444/m.360485 type:complete len:229 (+) Transcript_125444:542-1228(+)
MPHNCAPARCMKAKGAASAAGPAEKNSSESHKLSQATSARARLAGEAATSFTHSGAIRREEAVASLNMSETLKHSAAEAPWAPWPPKSVGRPSPTKRDQPSIWANVASADSSGEACEASWQETHRFPIFIALICRNVAASKLSGRSSPGPTMLRLISNQSCKSSRCERGRGPCKLQWSITVEKKSWCSTPALRTARLRSPPIGSRSSGDVASPKAMSGWGVVTSARSC